MSDRTSDIRRAREIARAFTDSLSPAPGADAVGTFLRVLSELVTTVLHHGGGHYTLDLPAGQDTVSVAVSDPNSAPPREVNPNPNGGN